MATEPQGITREDAIEQGKQDAIANAKLEENNGAAAGEGLEELTDAARDQAEINDAAEHKYQPESNQDGLRNDTSKAAKVRTTQSQLDPTGDDPISKAEVERAATDGESVHGGTSVSDEESAERAHVQGPGGISEPGTVPSEVAHPNRYEQPEDSSVADETPESTDDSSADSSSS